MADSIERVNTQYGRYLSVAEWLLTLLSTAEYLARLLCVRYPMRYATSFFGIIDLIAVLPTRIFQRQLFGKS